MAFTLKSGFRIKTAADITSTMMVSVIDHLHVAFGPGYSFVPEDITEGGIMFADWPGRKDGEYKTLRIQLYQSDVSWPWISSTTLDEWRTGPDVTLYAKGPDKFLAGGTFLKAFHGAPCWTIAELRRFRDAFMHAGISCPKKLPTSNSLKGHGTLGQSRKRARDVLDELSAL